MGCGHEKMIIIIKRIANVNMRRAVICLCSSCCRGGGPPRPNQIGKHDNVSVPIATTYFLVDLVSELLLLQFEM